MLLEEENGPGRSSTDVQTLRSQVGHRVTGKMGLTSKDGGANAGTGKANQTGLIS